MVPIASLGFVVFIFFKVWLASCFLVPSGFPGFFGLCGLRFVDVSASLGSLGFLAFVISLRSFGFPEMSGEVFFLRALWLLFRGWKAVRKLRRKKPNA